MKFNEKFQKTEPLSKFITPNDEAFASIMCSVNSTLWQSYPKPNEQKQEKKRKHGYPVIKDLVEKEDFIKDARLKDPSWDIAFLNECSDDRQNQSLNDSIDMTATKDDDEDDGDGLNKSYYDSIAAAFTMAIQSKIIINNNNKKGIATNVGDVQKDLLLFN